MHRPLDFDTLRSSLSAYEHRYGVPSDRLFEAFTSPDGVLTETDDFLDWLFLYGTLQDVCTVVTPEYFDFLCSELERPPRVDPRMMELLRKTRGQVEHR